jgi:hypothetical protein
MKPAATYYWHLVHDCLVEFHQFAAGEASELVRNFRLRLAEAPAEIDASVLYHEEPYALAARLARSESLVPAMLDADRYRALMHRRAKEAAVFGSESELHTLQQFWRASA